MAKKSYHLSLYLVAKAAPGCLVTMVRGGKMPPCSVASSEKEECRAPQILKKWQGGGV